MIDTKGKFNEISDYLVKYKKFQREPARNIMSLFSCYDWTGGFIWIGPDDYRAAAYLEELAQPDEVLAEGRAGERGSRVLRIDDSDKLTVGDDGRQNSPSLKTDP